MTTRRRFIDFMPLAGATFLAACGEEEAIALEAAATAPAPAPMPAARRPYGGGQGLMQRLVQEIDLSNVCLHRVLN